MELDTLLALAGGSLLVLGLLSRVIKRVFLSAVLLALLTGILVGPEVLGIVEPGAPDDSRRAMEELARLTLAIALMATGLHVTPADLRENARRAASLLSFGMLGMWLVSGVGAALLLDLPVWAGLLLGAILTPTDPVVASTLVTGPMATENLPRRVRRTLQLEAGANDGLALPLVLLGIFMVSDASGTSAGDWALEAAGQVGLALVVGLAVGFGVGRLTELVAHGSGGEQPNMLGTGLALALATLGLVALLGGSGVLAVFVAALTFSATLEEEVRDEIERVQETVTAFLVLPAFIFFGTILPWDEWAELGPVAAVFVAWILILRRPPVVAVALLRSGAAARETAFLAWFGPIGVAAIFYATHMHAYGLPDGERIFAAATLAICASVLAHSLSATPGVRLLAGRRPLATLARPFGRDTEAAP